jgi:hypothetical protein
MDTSDVTMVDDDKRFDVYIDDESSTSEGDQFTILLVACDLKRGEAQALVDRLQVAVDCKGNRVTPYAIECNGPDGDVETLYPSFADEGTSIHMAVVHYGNVIDRLVSDGIVPDEWEAACEVVKAGLEVEQLDELRDEIHRMQVLAQRRQSAAGIEPSWLVTDESGLIESFQHEVDTADDAMRMLGRMVERSRDVAVMEKDEITFDLTASADPQHPAVPNAQAMNVSVLIVISKGVELPS